ncbi:50S ribosome-binding GTPase [Rhizoctonia solani]|nr:50S ribosome-binding GTPase [Rhizoctonia solani]QRW24353.1 50S ribosome-binding GTPase [Rhizoctonia solani]
MISGPVCTSGVVPAPVGPSMMDMDATETRPKSTSLRVAIFGSTGAGKTTFVNIASGSKLRVGHDLMSCTRDVSLADTYQYKGHEIQLIDTPGFDDTNLPDSEVLRRIADFLAESYEKEGPLSGAIFFHSIESIRVGGAAAKTWRIFLQLCGEEAYKNALFVTNRWTDPPSGEHVRREAQLKDSQLFGEAIGKGIKVGRYSAGGTQDEARTLIASLFNARRLPFAIQREMVDEKLQLGQTAAGKVVADNLAELKAENERELAALREELEGSNVEDAAEIRLEEENLRRQIVAREAEWNQLVKHKEHNPASHRILSALSGKRRGDINSPRVTEAGARGGKGSDTGPPVTARVQNLGSHSQMVVVEVIVRNGTSVGNATQKPR